MAEALKREPDVEVQLVDGKRGEFTVLVDGDVVAKKGLIFKPSVETVVNKVKEAAPAQAGG